jgi:hypothetical protein
MATTRTGDVYISDDRGDTFELQTISNFSNPLAVTPHSFLAKDKSDAFLYVLPNYYKATIT